MVNRMALPNMISLGAFCRTRYQLERIIKPLRSSFSDAYPTYFWDWLYMGGASGAAWCIENDFQMNRNDFTISHLPAENLFLPVHVPSGYHFLHDFGGAAEDLDSAIAGFQEAYDNSSNKFSYLARRTSAIIYSIEPAAFIFYGTMPDVYAIKLAKLLNANGVERFLVNLIVSGNVGESPSLPGDPAILRICFDDENHDKPAAHAWQGSDSAWESVLSGLPIAPGWNGL